MSRVANCLKMLILLKSRGFMSREALANELECNIRNIGEYKKELELLGYQIESTTGKYGGYRLNVHALMPIVPLNDLQIKALKEANEFVISHNLVNKKYYMEAMDHIVANISNQQKSKESIYIHDSTIEIDKEIERFIKLSMQAIQDLKTLRIEYKGTNDQDAKKLFVQPYEIVHSKSSYYLLAYSLKAKAFRLYRFSKERMKAINITTTTFTRDFDFKVSDHIGELSLLKNQTYHLQLLIKGSMVSWVKENPSGYDIHYEMIDDQVMKYQCMIEGKYHVIEFLLKLKDQVEIISPMEIKQEMKELLEKMWKAYQ